MAMYLGNKKVAVTNTVEKQVPSMKAFFDAGGKCGCSKVTSFEGCWQYDDTANVTDMNDMFKYCNNVNTFPQFDTSKVTSMEYMFYSCSKMINAPQLDTSNVTNMDYMFSSCTWLKNVPQYDTSKVTTMRGMFGYCSFMETAPLLNTTNVTNMDSMFRYCVYLKAIPSLDMMKVTNADYMIRDCSNLEAIHLININTNLDFSDSTKLTREALLEIIDNLKAQTSGTKTLTMGSTNLAKLTDADKKIATDKGWTLA